MAKKTTKKVLDLKKMVIFTHFKCTVTFLLVQLFSFNFSVFKKMFFIDFF